MPVSRVGTASRSRSTPRSPLAPISTAEHVSPAAPISWIAITQSFAMFSEKLLLEACLEIMAKDCVIAIQDMGAAGLTCSAVEMGAKGDLGVTLELDAVPCRESAMSAYEMMLSESQERMLMVLKPEKEKEAEAIFRKWGLDFAVVGKTTPSKRFIVKHAGKTMVDLPIKELGDEAPLYDRPYAETPKSAVVKASDVTPPVPTAEALLRLIGS